LRFAPGTDVELAVDIDYIQQLADMTVPSDEPTEIPSELHDYIVTWMTADALRSINDPRLQGYTDKLSLQRASVIQSINERQIKEPVFVTGYLEDEEWY
jgi:uncharacterized membrane protein